MSARRHMSAGNLQVRVRNFPTGAVDESHFEVTQGPMPVPGDGEVLVRTAYLSLDPYMRKRLADAVEGRVKMQVGDLMMGRTVGEVVESRDAHFRPGDQVVGWGGWQQYAAEPADKLEKVAATDLPLSVHLGVLGRPGITAWLGTVHVANVRPADTQLPGIRPGQVKVLAVTTEKRYPGLPNVPTIGETVLPGFTYSSFFATQRGSAEVEGPALQHRVSLWLE
jgi:NADPH-dependent curcumin reductase CurA